MSRKKFITGAFILFISTFAVKIIGALYRIPLTDILGGEGMGYYSTAFNLFTPVYALCITGLPIAISHLVAGAVASGDEKRVASITRTAMLISVIIGIIGTILLISVADLFAEIVHNPAAVPAIICLSPTLLVSSVSSVLRGATQGRQNMAPTAISQLCEAIIKLVAGIGLAIIVYDQLLNRYYDTGYVLTYVYPTTAEAIDAIMPLCAAASLAGVTISNFIGTIILSFVVKKGVALNGHLSRGIAAELLRMALPVALSAVVINLTALIDLATIMRHIEALLVEKPQELYAAYKGLRLELMGSDLPNFLYGSYTGVAMSVFHLVPSLTVALGISIMPLVSGYAKQKNLPGTINAVETAFRFTVLLAVPAGFGIAALAGPILNLLYPTRLQEVAIATPMLTILGYSAILVAVLIPINTVFQAIGRPDLPVKLMLASAAVKFVLNLILVPIPQINIQGAAYSTFFCYLVLFVLSGITLCRRCKITVPIADIFFRGLGAGGLSAIVAFFTHKFLIDSFGNGWSLLICVVVSALFHLIVQLFFGILRKKDLLLLPFVKNLEKPLDFIFNIK